MKQYDVNCIKSSFQFIPNPVVTACLAGIKPVVEYLIKCGADCNQADKEDITPLFAAFISWSCQCSGLID